MILAFTVTANDSNASMDPRFGRAKSILITDENFNGPIYLSTDEITAGAHGAGPRMAQLIAEHKVEVLITGNGPGGNASALLSRMGTKVFTYSGEITAQEAFTQWKKGELTPFTL
ncbi:NifB/NifX family molybdenum-iron cluster-binding protein [Myxococcota bacterium]|nr:NifB/NifX family molybdenum-iron cluster-binding protein [Myxococcota bacterium]MBU1536452.1 NifB/NifX family molybdenum-iron cluster-binding protein [Myxococcota bacterium]